MDEINEFIKWKERTSYLLCSSARLESMPGCNILPQTLHLQVPSSRFIVFHNCEQCIPIGFKLSSLRYFVQPPN